MNKIIITTGGTGGHIYPALAVAKKLQENNVDVLFVGSSTRMEKDLVPNAKIKFIGLDIKPPNNIKNIISFIKYIFYGIKLIFKEKPDAVFGFGNYISVPVVFGGILFRKKVYLQEQNALLGGVNKLFYRFANKIFLAFDSTYEDIPYKYQYKARICGNPLRKEIYNISKNSERKKYNIDKNEKVLVITGGSLGAKSINDAVIYNMNLIKEKTNLKIFWATGQETFEEVYKKIENNNKNIIVRAYFDDLINLIAASDLVVCRAGALTISEIIQLEKPSVILPYGSLKVGQFYNAKMLKDLNGCQLFNNKDAEKAVTSALGLLYNEEALNEMSKNVKKLKKENTIDIIMNNL